MKDEKFPPGIPWDAGKVKRERKGLRTLDKKGEWVQSPICSLLVGLSKDRLDFEICTLNFASLASSPISGFGQITGPSCISSGIEHSRHGLHTNNCIRSPEGLEHSSTRDCVHSQDPPYTLFFALLVNNKGEPCLLYCSTSEGADTFHQAGTNNCFTLHKGSRGPEAGC